MSRERDVSMQEVEAAQRAAALAVALRQRREAEADLTTPAEPPPPAWTPKGGSQAGERRVVDNLYSEAMTKVAKALPGPNDGLDLRKAIVKVQTYGDDYLRFTHADGTESEIVLPVLQPAKQVKA